MQGMRGVHELRALGWLAAALVAPAPATTTPTGARLDYRMEYVVDGVQNRLEVSLRVSGLDPAQRDLAFELPIWGDWLSIDEYYVTRVSGTPPVHHDLVNRMYWRPELPAAWDGSLAIRYAIPIVQYDSAARASIALAPWRKATYVHGYSVNTLMRLMAGDERQDADRHVEFVAPEGFSVATGWGGVTKGRQLVDLAPGADNTSLLFGVPVAVAVSDGPGGHVEVAQFGAHADRTKPVLELAVKARAAYAATTGTPPPAAEHVFITEPGFGGTHTDGAVIIGHPELEGDRFDVGTAHFIAHELFHAWLPGLLAPSAENRDGGLEWFFEGFTDYFSLWHLAQVGLISPQQFGDQLRYLELFARESPACGKVAFADPKVKWRDPDAEPIAYKGGLMLAFHLDVELRERGEPGLPMLFRDLMRENGGKYDLAALLKWCAANGLEETWAKYVAAAALPDVGDDLVRLGFTETREGESRVIKAAGADLAAFFTFVPARGD